MVLENYIIQNIIEYDLRTLDNTIGQVTNIATYFSNLGHNDLAEVDKELIISSLMQNESIDYVKHGVKTITPPDNFKDAKKYKPYFLQKYRYKRDKNIQEGIENAPLNLLCGDIEEFEKELFKQKSSDTSDTSELLRNKEVLNENREETLQIYHKMKEIYQEFKAESSRIYLKGLDCEVDRRKAYDTFYDKFYYKVNELSYNKELLSSVAVVLNYIEDKRDNKTRSFQFPWICTWEGLSITIEKKAPEVTQVPKQLTRQELNNLPNVDNFLEFGGNFYKMVDVVNKITALDFINEQYNKKIEKELKQQLHKFELETTLYGFRDKTASEIVSIIADNQMKLGKEKLNDKEYAGIFVNGEYIASIQDKSEEIMDDELGYIDLKEMRNKVEVEIVEQYEKSLKVRLKLVV